MTKLYLPAVLTIMALAAPAPAQFADFDDLAEGFYDQELTVGGIRFYDINNVDYRTPGENGWPEPGEFVPYPPEVLDEIVIENATVLEDVYPDSISVPNMLTWGIALVPGPNLSLGRLVTMTMETGKIETSVSFDVIFYDEPVWENIEVTLDALRGEQVVATQSFEVHLHDPEHPRGSIDFRRMSISGVEFDRVRVYAHYQETYTTLRGVIDNVEFGGGGIPCDDVRKLTAACNGRGKVKGKVKLRTRDHDGQSVTVQIDSDAVEVPIRGRKAKFKECCYDGDVQVRLVDPAGCVEPLNIRCGG